VIGLDFMLHELVVLEEFVSLGMIRYNELTPPSVDDKETKIEIMEILLGEIRKEIIGREGV